MDRLSVFLNHTDMVKLIDNSKKEQELKELTDYMRQVAQRKKMDAGFAGAWDDRGASEILQQVEFYWMGFRREFPRQWEKYLAQMEEEKLEREDEYQTYLRLKKKFEHLDL